MKAILLALVFGIASAVAMTIALRVSPARRHGAILAGLFIAGLIGLALAFLATEPDLGFMAPHLIAPRPGLGLGFALFLYTAGYCGGLLQLYNLASRGLSLRVLIDVGERASCSLSAAEIRAAYCSGRGIAWMFEKRLKGLEGAGLVRRNGGEFALTPAGGRVAGLALPIRRVLGLPVPSVEDSKA